MTTQVFEQPVAAPIEEELEVRLRREAEEDRRRHERRLRFLLILGRVGLIVSILLLWELASGPILHARYVSKPSEIVNILQRWLSSGEIWDNLLTTLIEVLAGYALGVLLGLGTAIIFIFFQRTHDVLKPLIVAFYGIPKIALAPIIVMWFGLGITPKIVIATIIVFFVMFMNSYAGLSNVRPEWIDISRVMGGSRLQILRKVMLPAAAPFILTAMRLTIPDAVVGAIIGEFIAGSSGMGNLIRRSSSQLVTAGVFAGIFILALMVILMRSGLTPLERKFLEWREKR
jgi:NitT/TauT family transport system permease protein